MLLKQLQFLMSIVFRRALECGRSGRVRPTAPKLVEFVWYRMKDKSSSRIQDAGSAAAMGPGALEPGFVVTRCLSSDVDDQMARSLG